MIHLDGVGQYFTVKNLQEQEASPKEGSFHVNQLPELVDWCSKYQIKIKPSQKFIASLHSLVKSDVVCQEQLYPFQREGSQFLARNRIAFLFDEPGLGKTAQALNALSDREGCLVICPAYVKEVWRTEVLKWQPSFQVHICKKRQDFRFPKASEIVVCNYEILPEKPDALGTMKMGTVLIADEAQYIKSAKSKRTSRFRLLARRAIKHHGSVWFLTATPLLNKPSELWTIIQAVGLGNKVYKNYDRFVRLFGGYKDGLGVTKWTKNPKPQAVDPLRPFVLRRTMTDVLPEMPEKTCQPIILDLQDALLKKKLDLIAKEEKDVTEEIIRGWKYVQEIAVLRRQLAKLKIPIVESMVEPFEENGIPVVVFSCHREPVEAIGSRPGWATILGGLDQRHRNTIVEDFQNGRLQGLACTIKAAGVGITLTKSNHAIFIDREWSPPLNFQAQNRLLRIGQKNAVTIQELFFNHPLDYHVAKILDKKQECIDSSISTLHKPNPLRTEELRRILDMFHAA